MLLFVSFAVSAAIEPDTLARIKAATVFVSLGQHRSAGSGSGFLVHREAGRGLVVTNAHVVRGAASQDAIRVVFNSGTRRAEAVPASVLVVSRARDLAVLEVRASSLPEPLEVSRGSRIHETQVVHIAGFPFGKGFATNRETPVVSLSRGTVSSQRLDVNDQPRLLQIDGDLNPGNSGGPIVDDWGRVVGVAVSTVRQTNIGFAIPLEPLKEMLAGTLTDLEGERTKNGVRIRGRLLDPLKSFESARLRVQVMPEDRVLQLLERDGRWQSIAPTLPGTPFTGDARALLIAEHEFPADPPVGLSVVGQVSVISGGTERHLAPFRMQARELAISLTGPDANPVRAVADDDLPSGQAQGSDPQVNRSPPDPELDALFVRSGLNELISAMAAAEEGVFDATPRSDDERTVKERLGELIAESWDEERIRRIYRRSFRAEANADALRRALQIFSLPAMQTIHLTLSRLEAMTAEEAEALEFARKRDPGAFAKRLSRMRDIDERRNFSATVTAALSTSVGSLSRLLNDIHPRARRMAPELLDRDVGRTVSGISQRVRRVVPLMLMNTYRDLSDEDLDDYLAQLDSSAMRWFAQREMAAHGAVVAAQFTEAEEEILELFKEVRREALGIAATPELEGLSSRDAVQALIDAHGKDAMVDFVLARRGGEISVVKGGAIRSRFGRPRDEAVNVVTLEADMIAVAMQPPEFAVALENDLVNKAYRDRKLTARGERSRLIAALLERRRARILRSGRSRERAALRRQVATEKRQCETSCSISRSECQDRALRAMTFCKELLPASGRRRREGMAACRERHVGAKGLCRTEELRCRQVC